MGFWAAIISSLHRNLPGSLLQSLTALYFRATALRSVGFRGYHSSENVIRGISMRIRIIPALSDNYMYLLVDEASKEAAIVDPVEPDKVIKAVDDEGVKLTTILTTHHHWDHNGGNKEMVKKMTDLSVLGGDERIDGLTRQVANGDNANLGDLKIQCLATPCHTTGHICYYVTDDKSAEKVVFTGDTLFLGGCGRFFEGTADQMYEALVKRLGSLPSETKVYCGHEYALQNLAYGHHVEPDNQAIKDKIQWCTEMRGSSPPQPSVPSTIAEEKTINPFMRVEESPVQAHAKKLGVEQESDPIAVMKALRTEKDNFKAKK